jgi:hypothetical protein
VRLIGATHLASSSGFGGGRARARGSFIQHSETQETGEESDKPMGFAKIGSGFTSRGRPVAIVDESVNKFAGIALLMC